MNYCRINKTDIANGDGVRVSLWVSGCDRKCPGCFNKDAWNFNYGEKFTIDTVIDILEALKPDHIKGLTVLGGDPLDIRNVGQVSVLCRVVKLLYGSDKDIWLYTGYKYEDLTSMSILTDVDVLVDGEFIQEEADISLRFKGSKNQRILMLKGGEVIWE